MNGIDVALVVLLLLCALRGSWRGIFRESFGFAALLLGLFAALRGADAVAARLSEYPLAADLSASAVLGVAFVGIFLVVSTLVNLVGVAFDQLFGRGALRIPSRVAGALFALGKGAASLAVVLLFLRLFPVVPALDQQIATSRLARPMVSAAGAALRAGWRGGSAESRPA
jgi:uncharacterized membrane protein required for colicin V production